MRRSDPFHAALVALVDERIAASRVAASAWEWVPASAVFPPRETKRADGKIAHRAPSRALARLARREGWTLTRIAGELYARRSDLDELAARNAIAVGSSEAANDDDEVREDLERAFGTGGRP